MQDPCSEARFRLDRRRIAALRAGQYLILITWPWLLAKLKTEAGPFLHSSSIILWSFCAALIVLAGAEWSARVSLEEHVAGRVELFPFDRARGLIGDVVENGADTCNREQLRGQGVQKFLIHQGRFRRHAVD